ncbi:uncharacterized protein IL334_003774 [Kwoniella shivajii]|uniref:Uncharacterized protein n=1 Tax=Kwoniella shivajii TaxID=564305 RepID=A0ABZ1CYU9_9TREE|nr:hypothetical protein IL334_003774 [Kwoniella shivajii]
MPLLISRARHVLQPLKPLALSVGFSFVVPVRLYSTPQPGHASCTRRLIRQPSPAASRESPYPVVFLRAKGLGMEEEGEWVEWSSMFAEKGYTSVEIDINSPSSPSTTTSFSSPEETVSPFKPMITVLSSEIRLLSIPFPPILIASGSSTLLAQAYIEDNPSSGLILINPSPDEDPRAKASDWKWPVFKYEPHFPILVLSDHEGLNKLSVTNRLVRESGQEPSTGKGWFRRQKGVEMGVVDDLSGGLNERGRIEVERWMDRQGF